jgi:hypothetical protein
LRAEVSLAISVSISCTILSVSTELSPSLDLPAYSFMLDIYLNDIAFLDGVVEILH